MRLIIGTLLTLCVTIVFAKESIGFFHGRVSRVNRASNLMRVRVDFNNMKFLNKQDRVEFWSELSSKYRCESIIMGKTNKYLLLRVPNIEQCLKNVGFAVGGVVNFQSNDLLKNLKVAKEVVEILLKKRLAVDSKLLTAKKELDSYIERVEAVNKRYELLRQRLELEWQGQLTALEEDKATQLRNYKELQIRLNEVDHKLEQYRVENSNLKTDRWSLDSRLYFKK